MSIFDTAEGQRLRLNERNVGHWNRWGPYLSERAWGTVREDYSADGSAWDYFPHDHARSRAYRWNEDGLGGISDRDQFLCFGLALWNGHDPILKERMFGLTNAEGNHGEDVKEYYYYLDNTPTHSYMRFRYKYPQAPYPYHQLVRGNASRSRAEMEYELIDTGVFDEGRYFDVDVEYAKVLPEDLFIRITVSNRGPEAAEITVLPTLWFRNTWSWGREDQLAHLSRLSADAILAEHWHLERYALYCRDADELLFTENETNTARLFGVPPSTPFVKDAFHEYVIEKRADSVNPAHTGTKAAALYRRSVPAGGTVTIVLRLAKLDETPLSEPLSGVETAFVQRRAEADEFYAAVIPQGLSDDAKGVARQAFAGLLWSKQFYHYIVEQWLQGDPAQPTPPAQRLQGRNHKWPHAFCRDVLAVPDAWEFPWFASWDLAYQAVALAYVDPHFAKQQIILMFREWYSNQDGEVPAYEWSFDDVNPPVLSMAALRVFRIERERHGNADYQFLEEVFHKLLISFTWWANRKDALGNDIFQGGFLGLDNIGAFDRGNLPPGYFLGQVDGTAWMAAFAKNLFEMALILADRDPAFEGIATKFWEQFFAIADAMNSVNDSADSLWDDRDGFFYDSLYYPDGHSEHLRARTLLSFIPLLESVPVAANAFDRLPQFKRRREWFIRYQPERFESIGGHPEPGKDAPSLLGLVRIDQLRRLLNYMLDENEFLSPYGVRSVSRYHAEHPFIICLNGNEACLDYEPGESTTPSLGGNSNWRGPIWMPINWLIIAALERDYEFFAGNFVAQCPTGSGTTMNLHEIACELARRLSTLFLRGADGKRAVNGPYELFNTDPYWRDLVPFHEYFHADTGRGCGASHQTGWTSLIAPLLIEYGESRTAPS